MSAQLVLRLASRSAFSTNPHRRSASIGQTPISVWYSRYSSYGSGPSPTRSGALSSRQRSNRSRQPAGSSASAPIRARASPERLVSCVWVTSSPSGKRRPRSALPGVEVFDAQAEPVRVAADLVEGEQPQVAVERGVLDALGRDRRRRLLEAGDELVGNVACFEQERRGQLVGHAGDRLPVGRLDPPAPRLDVRPVDRQVGQRGAEGRRVELGRQPLEPRDLAGERARRLLELRIPRDLGERPARRRSARVQSAVSGSRPAGSTNSAHTSPRNS